MGNYWDTPEDILTVMTLAQVVELSADQPDQDGVYRPDWSIVETFLRDAQDNINNKLRRRVNLPLDVVPNSVRLDVKRLAKIGLFRRREKANDDMGKEEKRILDKYQAIADGDDELVGVTDQGKTASGISGAQAAGNAPQTMFGKKKPWGF
jgi:phage gp36-like protein